jgi:hypothetical protein
MHIERNESLFYLKIKIYLKKKCWKCKLSFDIPLSFEAILYDEDERPELFGFFVQGGSGQVLDNAHRNVFFGVANGIACTMHSLAWDDPEDKQDAHNAIRTSAPGQVIY